MEVKTETKTRVKECQGYGGAQRGEERENEWEVMAGNCRKSEKEERRGRRYEGRRDRVRKQGSDNKRRIAGDISSGQDGLKE